MYILSHASKAGSPMNRLGSGQRRDTDQGPLPMTDYLKRLKIWAHIRPVLLRQGEPGMSQYVRKMTPVLLTCITFGRIVLSK